MTDKRIKMDCPFCGCSMKEIQIKVIGKYVRLECPKCAVCFSDTSKQSVIDRWNRRI